MKAVKWNDNWKYWKEKDAFALVWSIDPEAEMVNLPHDAMREERAYEKSPNKGNTGYRDGGVYQYSKELMVEEADREKVLMLHFEGVYMNAMVYVNTQLAAKCPYGYTGFYVKLNDYLKYGSKNEIRVMVRNSGMANSRWYSGGGIYRDVYLLEGSRTYFRPDGTFITTENADKEYASVIVEQEICSRSYGTGEFSMEIEIEDPEGNPVATEKVPVSIFEGEDRKMKNRIFIREPKLWSDQTPELYIAKCRLSENGHVLDEQTVKFGIRQLSLDSRRGLMVNGETVKLRGACIHHDSGIIGAATFYDAEYRRISRLKEAGFNAVRMAHHPAAPTLLQVCDELGMYVMDEAFDMWDRCKSENDYALFFDKWWKADVEAMVRRDYCHPSVILYSIGNEIPEIGTDHGAKRCHDIVEKIRSLDTTRYTLAGINGVFSIGDVIPQVVAEVVGGNGQGETGDGNVNDFMAAMFGNMDKIITHPEVSKRIEKACAYTDIAGYNYMTGRYRKDGEAYPNRVIVGSETYPPMIAENWKIIKQCGHVIGDFTWTGWDYIGEAGVGVPAYGGSGDGIGTPYPCQLAYAGDIDITGFRRPASYFREIVFGRRMAPYICVQRPQYYGQTPHHTPWSLTDAIESWSFPGFEGKPIQVEVYSGGDEVELFVNGKSAGRKQAGEAVGYRIFFDTVYEAGTVRAVSYQNGEEAGSMELYSAEKPANVEVSVREGKTGELVYIEFIHTDQSGRLVTEEETEIAAAFSDMDAAAAAGAELYVGSGNHSPLTGYLEGRTESWNGRAQAIVRKADKDKKVTLQIKTKYGVQELKM